MATPKSATQPAHPLISSRRVEGTEVYNPADELLGTIRSVMIEKKSGKVAYALLTFGGFLGLAEHVHPIPWELLRYDNDMDAYIVDLTREKLSQAPKLHLDEADRPRDVQHDQAVSDYYGTPRWWS